MDEQKIKKQLFRISIIVIVSTVILCIVVFSVLAYIFQAAHEADHIQMKAEVEEYENRILKQIDKNFQILTTLSKAYEVSGITQNPEELEQNILQTNQANSFISLAYFYLDGNGILNTPGYGTLHDFTLDDCAPYAKSAIEQALQGKNAISKMFDSAVYDGKLFVYCVPVYENGEIVGALAASDTLEIFKDIVNGNTVMGGEGYIHILGAEGAFLVRSENTLVKEDMKTIFDGPYLSENTKTAAHHAFENQSALYGDFEYKGAKCHFYMSPIGLNGWYLFCANQLWNSSLSIGNIITWIGFFFLLILIVMFFLLYYGYYKFRKNSALLLKLAYFDPVTKAKNIFKFDIDFKEMQKKTKNYCIAAINIHNFKSVNDLFGVSGGDKLLCYIKQVIEIHITNKEFFCRASADLFYICLLETDRTRLQHRIQNLIQTVSKATSHAVYSYEISLYAGMSIQGTREDALVALQSIQNARHINIAFYTDELREKLREKNKIESFMYPALENNEFKLFLQPKYVLSTNKLAGAEALVRWQKPNKTYRYPNEFIPLFEENHFCIKLDMYMVEQVCRLLQNWIQQGITPIPISINQSKLLFVNGNYPEELLQILKRYQISPSLITLEILEGIAVNDAEQINKQILQLKEMGFRISMDDFGSGYSSLTMLYQLQIDELKLDKKFLQQTADKNKDRRKTMLSQIIMLAKKLGISTVAEGIETEQDKQEMTLLSCDYGQGYFYEKPIPADVFSEKYMKKDQTNTDL